MPKVYDNCCHTERTEAFCAKMYPVFKKKIDGVYQLDFEVWIELAKGRKRPVRAVLLSYWRQYQRVIQPCEDRAREYAQWVSGEVPESSLTGHMDKKCWWAWKIKKRERPDVFTTEKWGVEMLRKVWGREFVKTGEF